MGRIVRCQAVIIRDNKILVLRQYNYNNQEEYWMLPGGGLEEGETEEECIKREIMEETGLEINLRTVLFDEQGSGKDVYQRYVTFLCEAKAGSIPVIGNETVEYRKILEFVWCTLADESQWNEYLLKEQFYPSIKKIKEKVKNLNMYKEERYYN